MGIPVKITPLFWATAAVLGWLMTYSLVGMLIWVGIIFVSILFHEYGHAMTSKAFGQRPRIELVAFGGVTYPEGPRLPLIKEFMVVLAGPIFSFGLYLLGTLLLKSPAIAGSAMAPILQSFRLINLIWTIMNLFPIIPLDGGQLLRILCQGIFGIRGIKIALGISIVLAVGLGTVAFFVGWFLAGAFLLLFGFQNIASWKATKILTQSDQNEDFHKELMEAEEMLLSGQEERAVSILDHLRNATKSGVLFLTATQHLARIKFHQAKFKESYDLLFSIKKEMSEDFLLLLHIVAFEVGDYKTVHDLGAECFQRQPSLEIALRNAIASACLKEVKETIGWLEAATRSGLENLEQIAEEKAFKEIRNDPQFLEFLEEHKRKKAT